MSKKKEEEEKKQKTKGEPEQKEEQPKVEKTKQSVKYLKSAIEQEISKKPEDVSIIELVDLIVEHGFASRASDVHIEPAEDKVVVRLRIDGVLHDAFSYSKDLQLEVVSRVKVLADLQSDIHYVPQDGRFKVDVKGTGNVDVRVSIAPTYYGENVVMRILAEIAEAFKLKELGFSPNELDTIEKAIKKPYGMILANGPTGSGKTTTLYTIIKDLNTREVSIITIEDPIEYSISGITQMPLNVQGGLTFASGLRSILRQDPNIIMVGEIRDPETANIAVNAALTGHLMFSTLHTNDAATTFPRLLDMGVPPFLIASTVNIIIAQRLVRKVCLICRRQRTLSIAEIESFGGGGIMKELPTQTVYTIGKGCDECDGTGYMGRIVISEVMEVNEEIRQLIVSRADSLKIKQAAIKNRMTTLVENGFNKAVEGITTVEEVLRNVHE